MHKKLFIYLLIIVSVNIYCGSNTSQSVAIPSPPPIPKNIQTPSNISPKIPLEETKEITPEMAILKQAQIIRDRLRYFGEELKTSLKPEKHKALMENVREIITPACKEIETISKKSNLSSNKNIKDFLELCDKLDKTLATYNPKNLPDILKDFNSTFQKLESSLTPK